MKKLSIEQLEARQLLHGGAVHGPIADVDGNGVVSNSDFSMVIANWGHTTPYGDANGDGTVSNADFSAVIGAWGTTPHNDDAAKQTEHLALLQLFNVRTTTAAVMRSGDWSDPNTWLAGEVPAADAVVWVPAWYTLTVDGEVEAKHVRVDGTLDFAAGSHLTVDTLVGSATSHLDIDLPDADATARITFAGDAIDTNWDKFAISRGMVWHGSSDIVGAEKTTWAWMESANKGATQITVADATGWLAGDRLVIGGAEVTVVNYRPTLTSADDDVHILAIDGTRVTLDRPLAFTHAAVETQNPVVVNMTRNIVFESASADLDKRGHVMFMHNPDQHVAYAEFNGLGRTDKMRVQTIPDGRGGGLDNPLGRYALHFHRTGTESQAAEATGVSISGSPGWGLVNHDSNVNVDRSVSYDVLGAHFVTELGNEYGSFTNNVAIRADGSGGLIDNTNERRAAGDFGHTGEGFWLEGGNVTVEGNVAIGMRSSGFTFHQLSSDQHVVFRNNVTLQSDKGLVIWESRFPRRAFPATPPAGTVYSEVTNNFLHGGVFMAYTGCVELRNNTVVSFDNRLNATGIGHNGVNANIRYYDNAVTGFITGVVLPVEGLENALAGGYYDNLTTNLAIGNTEDGLERRLAISEATFGERATWNVYQTISQFTYNLSPAYGPNQYGTLLPVPDWRPLFASPNRVIGQEDIVTLDGVRLAFAEQAADFQFGELLYRFPDEIRYEPDGVTLATGASLNARGLYVGGQPLPDGQQYHLPKIRGVLVQQ